ncbi:unnamed protein product, partial [Closterium sp. Naga37s-1]
PPGYYFRPGSGAGKDSWHVFLPFGGWCTTPGECKWRATQIHYGSTKPALQATNPFNNALQGYRGILSTNKTDNPRFYNWNLVMPVYCDGGGFAGRAGFKNVSGSEGVYLLGWNIIKAVLTDVTDRRGLKTASQVLLSGVSAGAEAVVTLCDQLPALVPSAKTTKCLMDSGFFLGAFTLPILLPPSNIQPPSASWTRASSSVRSPSLYYFPPPIFNHQVPHGLGLFPCPTFPFTAKCLIEFGFFLSELDSRLSCFHQLPPW